jgi:hypothetical protein
MCEPSPRSRGPLLRPVHGGLTAGTGRRAHRRMARGRYGGRELTAETPRERGDRGEPHRGIGGRRGGTVWPSDGETKQRQTELVGEQYGCGWSEPMRGMGRWCGGGALGCLL